MDKNFSYRKATVDDIDDIRALMDLAIIELQKAYLDEDQLNAAHQFMGIDTQLIEDGTYFIILHNQSLEDEKIVGCGGWGKRATLYGGNHTKGRNDQLLDPDHDRARIRAMYCHPDWARRGIGRYIIEISEKAAQDEGFSKMTLGSTLAGLGLYKACGYHVVENEFDETEDGIKIPVFRMEKDF